MNIIKCLIWFSVLLFCLPASAQFYRYVDEQGVVRFTDDLDKIPEKQRSKVTSFEESKSKNVPSESLQQEENKGSDNAPTAERFNKKIEELEGKRRQLDAEYKALMEKKEAIIKMDKKTRVGIIKYNETITKLNEEIQIYENKRLAFDKEVEAHNEMIRKELKQRLEKNTASSDRESSK